MNIQGFVRGVLNHMAVRARGEIDCIQSPPPGRNPLQKRAEMHNWYRGLSEGDKAMVQRLIRDTVEGTVYGFLMILDHKTFIEGAGQKGELQLHYRAPNGSRVRLNPLGGENGKDLEYYFKTLRDASEP